MKQFEHPYMVTITKDWVRYQILPASLHGHSVNPVYQDIEVNADGSRVKIPTEFFHCIHCKLMGTIDTLREYSCAQVPNTSLIQYRRDYYKPTEEDLKTYQAIRTEEGWWYRREGKWKR